MPLLTMHSPGAPKAFVAAHQSQVCQGATIAWWHAYFCSICLFVFAKPSTIECIVARPIRCATCSPAFQHTSCSLRTTSTLTAAKE